MLLVTKMVKKLNLLCILPTKMIAYKRILDETNYMPF